MIISSFFLIIYLNLYTMGYSWFEYLVFVGKRIECLILLPGIFLVNYSVFKGGKHVICI